MPLIRERIGRKMWLRSEVNDGRKIIVRIRWLPLCTHEGLKRPGDQDW